MLLVCWKLGHTNVAAQLFAMRVQLQCYETHCRDIAHSTFPLQNYTGVHTSRAARIEPITPPGCVYCSQAFAAMSETLCVNEYECTYVGNVPLAKGYGLQPVYHVRWCVAQSDQQFKRTLAKRVLAFVPTESHDSLEDAELPHAASLTTIVTVAQHRDKP